MKTTIVVFALSLLSTNLMAENCNSSNLNKEIIEINSNDKLTNGEKSTLIEAQKNVKLTQILTCMGIKNLYLSNSEAKFAKQQFRKDKQEKIESLNEKKKRLEILLQGDSLGDAERDLFSQVLQKIPQKIKSTKEHYRSLLRQVENSQSRFDHRR